jgi:hypothetical protein
MARAWSNATSATVSASATARTAAAALRGRATGGGGSAVGMIGHQLRRAAGAAEFRDELDINEV